MLIRKLSYIKESVEGKTKRILWHKQFIFTDNLADASGEEPCNTESSSRLQNDWYVFFQMTQHTKSAIIERNSIPAKELKFKHQ